VKKQQYAKAEPLSSRKKDFLRRLVSKTRNDYKAKTHVNDIAPFSPSPDDMVEKVLLKLKPTAEDTMVDLGCGDARWLLQASKRFGCTCVGIEMDESLVVKAQKSVVDEQLSGLITIKKGDIYEEDISEATIVVVYAFAKVHIWAHCRMRLLRCLVSLLSVCEGTREDQTFDEEPAERWGAHYCCRGTSQPQSLCTILSLCCYGLFALFVCVQFKMKGWEADWVDRIKGLPVYVYTWPK
jgi:hypothetical protein